MTGRTGQFSRRRYRVNYEYRNQKIFSILVCTELDLEHISSFSSSSASSTVRGRSRYFNGMTDHVAKVTVDGLNDRSHVFKSVIIGGPGSYVPFPSHSFLTPIGPTAWVLMLDCRCVDYNSR